MKIYEKTNTFKCYATGEQGDVIKFYVDYYRISFKDALKELASKAGITRSEAGVRSQEQKIKKQGPLFKKQNRIERDVT